MTIDERHIPPVTGALSTEAVIQAKLNRWDQYAREAYFRVTNTVVDEGADAVVLVCREYQEMAEDWKKLKTLARDQYLELSQKSIAHRQALDAMGQKRAELEKLRDAVKKLGEVILEPEESPGLGVRPGSWRL